NQAGDRTSFSGVPFMPTRTRSARRSNGARAEWAPTPPETNKLVVCRANGHFTMKVNPDDISEIIKQKDQFVWLDLQDPQEHDIALLRDEFKFHPLAIEDQMRIYTTSLTTAITSLTIGECA